MITHNDLVEYLVSLGSLHSNHIIEAFKNVDRADFVADPNISDIYADYPLQIGLNQTISQPRTVAMMMEMLEPSEGQKILDIGSGSGWTTALLSFIVGKNGSVIGVERLKELVEFGKNNLKKYGFKNAKVIQATDTLGVEGEKFDRILVSAAADELPSELLKQLKIDGKLVIPIKNSIYEIKKIDDNNIQTIKHYGFVFVPLIYK